MKRFGHWSNFIILGGIIFLVYSPSLATFFSQDDFTHLALVQVKNLREVIGFFGFKTSGIYYRPLSVQLITWLAKSIFGLRPGWFHLVALALHIVTTIVVNRLVKKLVNDDRLAMAGAVFYGVHPVHFMSIFWWAEVSMVMAPLFSFLAIWAWLEKRNWQFLIWLILALLSNELAISVIPIALLLKPNLRKLIPAGLISAIIVAGRWLVKPPSLGTEYGIKFLPQIALGNLRWQIVRTLGFIEGFRGQLKLPLAAWSVIIMGLAVILVGWMGLKKKFKLTPPLFWLGWAWFGLALLPVLFLERHQSPIYQIIGLPGFFLVLAEVLKQQSDKLVVVWLGLFIAGSLLGVRGMQSYHWVTQRAREAKYYINKLEQKGVQNGQAVIFLNSQAKTSTRAYIALGAGNGVRVWFGNETQIYFEDFGLPGELAVKTHYVVSNFNP